MNTLIGFSAIYNATQPEQARASAAQERALSHFAHLKQQQLSVGKTRLAVWGHNNIESRLHRAADGSVLALIGQPIGDFSWQTVEDALHQAAKPEAFTLPWDGRLILLQISANGQDWTMWNDWLGSIPVFHAPLSKGRVASALEPVTVAATNFSSNDIFVPALLSLLIHGHYLSDWTLFKKMKTLPPDCAAKWDEQGFAYKQLFTVAPSTDRWECGWDDLVDEAHHLARQSIGDVLQMQPNWTLPLSGGLDSRLIAAVGAELGANMRAYTFGAAASRDALYAKQVANTLNLPWQRIGLNADYLSKYIPLWADLFGSAMHFHGMHQMFFLDALPDNPAAPILSGFLGEALAGYDVRFMSEFHAVEGKEQIIPDSYIHWKVAQVKPLMKIPIDNALAELAATIKADINSLPGARFQQLRYLILWSRQRAFTYFSSALADYWRGVTTPFLNRAYARFWNSLPRAVLDDRRLFADMFQRYYPALAALPSTYWRPGIAVGDPLQPTVSYLLKRRLAAKLPAPLLKGPLQEFSPRRAATEQESFRAAGRQAVWPVYQVWDNLAKWVDLKQIEQTYQAALNGSSVTPIRKLQSIQTLAYRLEYSEE